MCFVTVLFVPVSYRTRRASIIRSFNVLTGGKGDEDVRSQCRSSARTVITHAYVIEIYIASEQTAYDQMARG